MKLSGVALGLALLATVLAVFLWLAESPEVPAGDPMPRVERSLTSTPPTLPPVPAPDAESIGAPEPVTAPVEETALGRLMQAFGVSGRVYDSDTGRPLAAFQVQCRARGPPRGGNELRVIFPGRTLDFTDGVFSGTGQDFGRVPEPEDEVRVEVSADGYLPFRSEWFPVSDGPVELDVAMRATGVVHGIVRTADGRPIEDLEVYLVEAGLDVSESVAFATGLTPSPDRIFGADIAETEPSGAYRLRSGTPRTFRVWAWAPGYSLAESVELQLTQPGDRLEVDLVLTTGGSIRCEILRPDAGPMVSVSPPKGDTGPVQRWFGEVDPAQEPPVAIVRGLPPGRYNVSLWAAEDSQETLVPFLAALETTVVEGAESAVRFDAPAAGIVVHGRMTFVEGVDPAAHFVLQAAPDGRLLSQVVPPAADGSFQLECEGVPSVLMAGTADEDGRYAASLRPISPGETGTPPTIEFDLAAHAVHVWSRSGRVHALSLESDTGSALVDDLHRQMDHLRTDDEGHAWFRGLPAGRHVIAWGEGDEARRTFVIGPGSPAVQEWEIP